MQRGAKQTLAVAASAVVSAAVVLAVVSCATSNTPQAPTVAGSGVPTTTPSTGGTQAPGTSVAPQEGATVAAAPSRGCTGGTAPTTKGAAGRETLAAGGTDRTYIRFVPTSYTGTTPVPLLVDLHGYAEGATVHTVMSDMNASAEARGFVNLTPDGPTFDVKGNKVPYWNAFGLPQPDDVAFIDSLLDATEQQLCIDTNRVYVTGLSNGAFMTSKLACELSDRFAAAAPVAGLQFPEGCTPTRPIPIVAFHGTADEFVTYDGHVGSGVATLPGVEKLQAAGPRVELQAIPAAQADWANAEGCAPTPTESPVSEHVKLVAYTGCRGGSVIELYLVDGGGHAWPGSQFSASIANVVGTTTMEIDANDIMWAFFDQHPLPA